MNVTPEFIGEGLRRARYITNERVETSVFLALALDKPLLIEGPAGSGKTEGSRASTCSSARCCARYRRRAGWSC
jgi:MoxR-like ATPase